MRTSHKKFGNSAKGKIWYGLHCYPGVAEYQEDGKDPYRVYLSEETLRSMDPTFAGCPVYVEHVDEVPNDVDEVRKDADGWVIESFFNPPDGKHWVKFTTVSQEGDRAAASASMKLSNCYLPNSTGQGGVWNGVQYDQEILGADYEHLAIVSNPRYAESIILTPEQFKQYNKDQEDELKRLANDNKMGVNPMKFNFFKRQKVENSADLSELIVALPKSGREIAIVKLINDADEAAMKEKEPIMAHPDHLVEVGGEKMKVNDLLKKYEDACNEMEAMKGVHNEEEDDSGEMAKEADEEVMHNDDEDEGKGLGDDEVAHKRALELAAHEEKEIEAAKKKNAAIDRADRLRKANKNIQAEEYELTLTSDRVALGKKLF